MGKKKPHLYLRYLNFIWTYIQDNQRPPTIRDIRAGLEVKSTSTVSHWVDILEARGFIWKHPEGTRNITVTQDGVDELDKLNLKEPQT